MNLDFFHVGMTLYRTVPTSLSRKVKDQIQSVLGSGGSGIDGDEPMDGTDTTDALKTKPSADGVNGSEKCKKSGKQQLAGKKLALKKKLWTPYSSHEKE